MKINIAKIALASLLCACATLVGCAGAPTATPTPSAPVAATNANGEKVHQTLGKAEVAFPAGMDQDSSLSERVDFTATREATLDAYWMQSPSGGEPVYLAAVRVYSDAPLYADPPSPEAMEDVRECLKRTVYPTLKNAFPDLELTPPFEEAQLTEGTYRADAGDLPMIEIQTQDAYWLRAVIAPEELIVLFGFTKGDKTHINDFMDSLVISK